MENFDVVEGNLRAVKDHDDFGGKNMWNLYVKTVRDCWVSIQWMHVSNIQNLFQTKLPVITG